MKRILTALTFALLLLTLVACGGSIQPPDVPDEPTVPEEPQGPARKYIQWQNSTWIAERFDMEAKRKFETRLEIQPNYGTRAVFDNLSDFNESCRSFSDAYAREFCDKFFDVPDVWDADDYGSSKYGIRTAHATVRYYATSIEYLGENEQVEHDYYIEFEFLMDYLNASSNKDADSSVYNRVVYAIKQPDPYFIPSEDNEGYQVGDISSYAFKLVPLKSDDEEYFTDQKKDEIVLQWYESFFKSGWATPEVGTAMVELIEGSPSIPTKIRFTIDDTVPGMTEEGGLELQHPTALLNLGTLRRNI